MFRWLIAASLAFSPWAGAAAQSCGPRAEVLAMLASEFGERPVAQATAGNGCIVDITAGPTGTWTTLVSCPGYPPGVVCWGNSGTGWTLAPTEPAAPAPTPIPGRDA